ncbi:MAG: hypothetical protein GXO21_02265 [Aquificae bacterium]|nr:hypothetical protein [Aquificota bacterium]
MEKKLKKMTIGNIKFTKPVVEKIVDIHYILEGKEEDILKHKYFILTYEEFDKPLKELIKEEQEDKIRFAIIDETISINFGDEEIQKHKETVIEYDEEWLKKFNPDYKNFESWIIEFADEIVFSKKVNTCKTE